MCFIELMWAFTGLHVLPQIICILIFIILFFFENLFLTFVNRFRIVQALIAMHLRIVFSPTPNYLAIYSASIYLFIKYTVLYLCLFIRLFA